MHYHYFTIEQRAMLARQMIGMLNAEGAQPGRLDTALSFLRSPEYGICEACGADIPYSKLFDQPLARHCRRCEAPKT